MSATDPARSANTLGAVLRARDEQRFVGRVDEVATITRAFEDDPPHQIVLVHGPGGIGKSTLLREIARRGTNAGWTPIRIDGRDLSGLPGAMSEALRPAADVERALVLIDTFEVIGGLAGHLRAELIPALPARTVVVIAGRAAPDPLWFTGGWERLTREIHLEPFTRAEAIELLRARGTTDLAAVDTAIEWSRGSPLALATAAASGFTSFGPRGEPEVLRRLASLLVDEEADGLHLDALALAAFARTVDADLVRAVLPDADAATACDWLGRRTFMERHGSGLAMHDLVAHVLRVDLEAREPDLAGDLRRRIADHAYEQAVRQQHPISLDIAHVIDDPAVRWGFGEGFGTHRLDDVRPGDGEIIRARLEANDDLVHWQRVEPYLRAAPGCVTVVRDSRDRLTGFTISLTPASAPPAIEDDPVLSRWVAHARGLEDGDHSVLWQCATNFEHDPEGRAQGLLGLAGFLRCGLSRVRYCYLPIAPDSPGALAFSEAAGAVHLTELDHADESGITECHLADFGPAGSLGALLAVVYSEVGAPLPDLGAADVPRLAGARVAVVRDAFRGIHDPRLLRGNPLVPDGLRGEAAVDAVRSTLTVAMDASFGDRDDDQLLRRVLELGYLAPDAQHSTAAAALFLSRATYFRRLRAAVERVAEAIDWSFSPS